MSDSIKSGNIFDDIRNSLRDSFIEAGERVAPSAAEEQRLAQSHTGNVFDDVRRNLAHAFEAAGQWIAPAPDAPDNAAAVPKAAAPEPPKMG
jgi:hypothetical protein